MGSRVADGCGAWATVSPCLGPQPFMYGDYIAYDCWLGKVYDLKNQIILKLSNGARYAGPADMPPWPGWRGPRWWWACGALLPSGAGLAPFRGWAGLTRACGLPWPLSRDLLL